MAHGRLDVPRAREGVVTVKQPFPFSTKLGDLLMWFLDLLSRNHPDRRREYERMRAEWSEHKSVMRARRFAEGGAIQMPAKGRYHGFWISGGMHWHDARADINNDPPCDDPDCPLGEFLHG